MRSSTHRILAALPLLAVAACRDLTSLQQSNPGSLSAASTYTPANALLLTNGAISDFECAFSRYVAGTGLFTDELSTAISATANFDYDRRTFASNASYGTATCGANQQPPIYTTLSTARGSAELFEEVCHGGPELGAGELVDVRHSNPDDEPRREGADDVVVQSALVGEVVVEGALPPARLGDDGVQRGAGVSGGCEVACSGQKQILLTSGIQWLRGPCHGASLPISRPIGLRIVA